MNLFRAEEHIRNWESFVQGTDAGILPLPGLVDVFSGPFFKRRLDEDYVSRMAKYQEDFLGTIKGFSEKSAFWNVS